jgi:outer membrane protein TolC
MESLAEAVAGYGEVARVEALRLAHGAGTQPDLLDAEADVLAARAELAEARFARIAATTEIGRLTGSLDAGWVAAHLDPAVPGPAGTPEAP